MLVSDMGFGMVSGTGSGVGHMVGPGPPAWGSYFTPAAKGLI